MRKRRRRSDSGNGIEGKELHVCIISLSETQARQYADRDFAGILLRLNERAGLGAFANEINPAASPFAAPRRSKRNGEQNALRLIEWCYASNTYKKAWTKARTLSANDRTDF